MIRLIGLPMIAAMLVLAASATAAPPEPYRASVAANVAFSNTVCADSRAKGQVAIDFAEAVRLHFPALALRMTPDTRIVVPEAHAVVAQGYPNGFTLENGRVKSVSCQADLATRINGKIVEYRGILFQVTSQKPNPPLIQTIAPGNVARFIDHLFIDNEPLRPGNGSPDFVAASQDESIESVHMIQAGIRMPITPEMRMQWRLRHLEQLLGPVPGPVIRCTRLTVDGGADRGNEVFCLVGHTWLTGDELKKMNIKAEDIAASAVQR